MNQARVENETVSLTFSDIPEITPTPDFKRDPIKFLRDVAKKHEHMFYIKHSKNYKYLVVHDVSMYEDILTFDDTFGTPVADNMQVNKHIFQIDSKQLKKHEQKTVSELRKYLLKDANSLATAISDLVSTYIDQEMENSGQLDIRDFAETIFWPMTQGLIGKEANKQKCPHLLNDFYDIDDKFGVALKGRDVPEVKQGVSSASSTFFDILRKQKSMGPMAKFYHDVTNQESFELTSKFCTAGWWGGQGNTIPSFVWTLYFILSTPSVLSQVRKLKSNAPKLTEYLTQCFKETLRLTTYSIAWRTVKKDNTLESKSGKKFFIKKGTQIGLHFCLNHFDDAVYPNPDEFSPDRFENEIGSSPVFNGQKYAWVPFSAGRHKCSGYPLAMKEVPLALARLFEKLDLEICADDDQKTLGFNFQQAFGVVSPDEVTKITVNYKKRTSAKL